LPLRGKGYAHEEPEKEGIRLQPQRRGEEKREKIDYDIEIDKNLHGVDDGFTGIEKDTVGSDPSPPHRRVFQPTVRANRLVLAYYPPTMGAKRRMSYHLGLASRLRCEV